MLKKALIVVPCFNEEKRLKPELFLRALDKSPFLHWLFVNDGSKDQTQNLLEGMRTKNPARVFVHQLRENRGKGEAVRQGLLEALKLQPDLCGYFDADLATPLSELERLLNIYEQNPKKVLLGSRVFLLGRNIERSWWRFWLGRCFAIVASPLLGLKVYDTQCGAKLLAPYDQLGPCLQSPFVSRWLFDVELIHRLIKIGGLQKADFYEEPLRQWTDVGGSKVKFHSLLVACFDLAKIYFSVRGSSAAAALPNPSEVRQAPFETLRKTDSSSTRKRRFELEK